MGISTPGISSDGKALFPGPSSAGHTAPLWSERGTLGLRSVSHPSLGNEGKGSELPELLVHPSPFPYNHDPKDTSASVPSNFSPTQCSQQKNAAHGRRVKATRLENDLNQSPVE